MQADNRSDRAKQGTGSGAWSIGRTVKAVAWSFFGVRRASDHEDDMQRLNPVVVIVTGLVLAALFVGTLLVIVNHVVK